MRRFIPLLLVLAVAGVADSRAQAEDSAGAQELRDLKEAVQLQSKQIEMLAEQIGKLTHALEAQKPSEAPAATPATTSIEAPKPAAEAAPEAPKAEPVVKTDTPAGGTKHVVAKGETLTSIAKHYNIPIAELKNANKIENERKLQIGQILTVPTAKTPETPEKKENP